jgi:hypothetical protein
MRTHYLIVSALFVLSMVFSGWAEHGVAAISDNYTLTVDVGKPPVTPNVATVKEKVTFNFSVSLYDKTNRRYIEETPPDDVKSIKYSVSTCSCGELLETSPAMVMVQNSVTSAATTQNWLYSSVSAQARFADSKKHSVTLTVEVVFTDDSSLSASKKIEVNVYEATFTVYAKSPDKIVFLHDPLTWRRIPHTVMNDPTNPNHDFIGHSFWKCEVEQSLLSSQQHKNMSGTAYGYYPRNGVPALAPTTTVLGELRSDTGNSSASKSYAITVSKAKAVLDETAELLNPPWYAPLWYNLIAAGADNCTAKAVSMCGTAGVNAPDGKGIYGIIRNETDTFGIFLPFSFPNPYHHAIQLGNAQ